VEAQTSEIRSPPPRKNPPPHSPREHENGVNWKMPSHTYTAPQTNSVKVTCIWNVCLRRRQMSRGH